jgi:uncharacterized membrane protein
MFPPIPSWEGIHPLVVHFPIALLLVAPIFVVLGVALPRHARWSNTSALILMALGTIGVWTAVGSGEAAAELVTRTTAIAAALERHESMAETTRTVFTTLTAVFAALTVASALVRTGLGGWPRTAAHVAFLALYLGGALYLVNTAHQGGLLVHDLGVRSMVASSGPAAPTPPAALEGGEVED